MSLHTGQLPSPKLTNKSPLKLDLSKRKLVFQPSISRCTLLVWGRVYNKYIPTSVNAFFLLKPFFVKNHQQISTAPSPGSDVIWGCQNDTQRTESDGCFGSWKSTELPFTVQFSLERKASTYRKLCQNCQRMSKKTIPTQRGKKKEGKHKKTRKEQKHQWLSFQSTFSTPETCGSNEVHLVIDSFFESWKQRGFKNPLRQADSCMGNISDGTRQWEDEHLKPPWKLILVSSIQSFFFFSPKIGEVIQFGPHII